METLVSLKNSYSEFKESFGMQLSREKGLIKQRLSYGKFYDLKLQENKILFYIKNNDMNFERLIEFLKWFLISDEMKKYSISIVLGSKVDPDVIPQEAKKYIQKEARQESQKSFADAKYIIASDNLPIYFTKKEGQRVLRIMNLQTDDTYRWERAKCKISGLLNSSVIVVGSSKEKKILEEVYQLKGLQDHIEIVEESEIEQGKILLNLLLNETKAIEEKQKENILITISNWAPEDERYLRLIAENINYDRYDLTVLMKRPQDRYVEEIIQNINSKTRILYRQSTFPCSVDKFIDIQYLLKNFDAFEDFESAYEKLDLEIVKRECKRIFGNTKFKSVIYFGKSSSAWSVLVRGIETENRIRLEYQDLLNERQNCNTDIKKRGFDNRIKLYNKIFDKVVFSSASLRKNMIEEGYFEKNKTAEFEFPVHICADDKEKQIVKYDDKCYLVSDKCVYRYGGMRMDLLPLPDKDQKAYIANSEICDEEKLLLIMNEIYKMNENSVFVAYGSKALNVRESAKKYGLDQKIDVIEEKRMEFEPVFMTYLNYFTGYILTEETDQYCPIRVGMELQDKDIITYEDDRIKRNHKKFKYQDVVNKECEERWDEFLNLNL